MSIRQKNTVYRNAERTQNQLPGHLLYSAESAGGEYVPIPFEGKDIVVLCDLQIVYLSVLPY